jgi:hypothetical protein
MKTQSCSKLESCLVELAEGSLTPELQREMNGHLADCPSCLKLFQGFAAVWEELSPRPKREPPASLWPSLERALDANHRFPYRSRPLFAGVRSLLRPAALSLGVLLAAWAGFQLGNPQGIFDPSPRFSELSPGLRKEAYAAFYLEPFTDFPEGSLSKLYLGIESPNEDKKP